ncbi:MAG: signal peptidase II [Caldicoprobacter oshimai]|uniref:Lipoprotein signal peptidase n=1 Tax=Caldicoprobacter faecalis TaxID=937334 RepID=A0A1I5SEC1_9FIRM|nr:signal peptidase II [Caldicoprobacter faecalis]SFP69063.1 signal peptidase II Aspartic peptidase. MEROPS family A08 [Caldicoprobacter faecalis]
MLQVFIVAFIVVLDQVTKYLAKTYLKPVGSIPLIPNVFHFTYVENRGAAFGILQNQRWLFIVLTVVVSAVIVYYLFTRSQESIVLTIALSMILGGAIGNLIDRLRLGYVVDMLHFVLIDYPVFNVADSFVVIGTILLAYYILFMADSRERQLS